MFLLPIYLALRLKALHCACCSLQRTYYSCTVANNSVLRFKLKFSNTKILCYERVQNSPIKTYSWETLGLNPRIGIKAFFQIASGDKFQKSYVDTEHHHKESWLHKGTLSTVENPDSLQALAGRWLASLTAAAALAPAQCSHRAPITRLHSSTDGTPSSICP